MNDLRYALRMLWKSPAFSIVAVATLALGIGANTAIFSVISSVLLSPLPFPNADRMVRIVTSRAGTHGQPVQSSPSPAHFHFLRERSQLLERVAAQRFQDLALTGDAGPDRVTGIGVSDQWLETLTIQPLIGRGFNAQEQAAGSGNDVVLISNGFWRRYFGGAVDILGRTLRLNERNYTVIGVMPVQFRYPYNADLWLPMTLSPTATRPSDLNLVGLVKPGVTDAQLAQELDTLAAQFAREFSGNNDVGLVARRFKEEFGRDPNRSIAALALAVGFVLAIACVNVANLQMARGQARVREMAIRAAIGASRARQIRQLLTESLVLAALGGACGVLLTLWGSAWLETLIPSRLGEVIQHVRVSAPVLIFSTVVCLLAGILFGLAPALRISQGNPAAALKDGPRTGSAVGARLLRLFVIAQVALAVVLLVGAGSMAQNFMHLLRTDVGYETENLLKIELGFPQPKYTESVRRVAAVDEILHRLETVPGVAAAAVTTLQPIPRTTSNLLTPATIEKPADPSAAPPTINHRSVSPSYFRTIGIRLLRGRAFTDADTETSEPVVIVNEATARRLWPGQEATGQRMKPGRVEDPTVPWCTVIGVVNDIAEPNRQITETLYQAYAQAASSQPAGSWETTSVSLMVRGTGKMPSSLSAIRSAVWEIDSTLPMHDAVSMRAALAEPLSDQRLGTTMFLGFGAFGLLMAALGTYGVLAFSVNNRRPELGIRLALGAQPSDLLRMVLSGGLRLVLVGLLTGTVAAMLFSRLVGSFIAEVSGRDPVIFIAVSVVLLLAGALACWIPARRASRVDPMITLRAE